MHRLKKFTWFAWRDLITLIIIVVIVGFLLFVGILKIPSFCDGTYDVHGDSLDGPVYIETVCVSHAHPWNISFWSTIIKNRYIK